jgi:hypothetical protein
MGQRYCRIVDAEMQIDNDPLYLLFGYLYRFLNLVAFSSGSKTGGKDSRIVKQLSYYLRTH